MWSVEIRVSFSGCKSKSNVLATSHVFPETLKKNDFRIGYFAYVQTQDRGQVVQWQGGHNIYHWPPLAPSEAILAPLLIPYLPTLCPSLTPGSCSDLIGGAIDTKRFEQKQSCGWVLTDPLTVPVRHCVPAPHLQTDFQNVELLISNRRHFFICDRSEQKQASGCTLTNPPHVTPLRPDSTVIDGFSKLIPQRIAVEISYLLVYCS